MKSTIHTSEQRLLSRVTLITLFFLSQTWVIAQSPIKWESSEQPLSELNKLRKKITIPQFKKKDYNIIDFGAKADGVTQNTEAINKAIEICHKNGGGKVIVPAGTFLTGPIYLKSKVNLHLVKDAVILFSTAPQDYNLVLSRWEGMDCMNYSPQIYAYKEQNIAITGEGTINGAASAKNWWIWKGSKRFGWNDTLPNQLKDRELLHKMMHEQIEPSKRVFGKGHFLRPYMFQAYLCRNILVSGVTMIDSPMWFISPVMCENITIEKVTIKAHGPNTDGCDPDACKNVLIKQCFFDTGDDCIAIKSGRDEDGRQYVMAAENHIIEECEMKNGHGGITIGSEIAGGAKNIYAINCKLSSPALNMVIRLKTSSSRGGTIENIFMKDINVGTYNEAAISCDMFYEQPGKHIPTIRNVWIENLTVRQGGKYGIFIHAYKESPVQDLTMINCTFKHVGTPLKIDYVQNFSLSNVFMNGQQLNSEPNTNSK